MRDIKFRAWDKVNKKMFLVSAITYSRIYEEFYHNDKGKFSPRKDIYLMQYTGLKDMSGNKIYEGDICKVSDEEPYSNDYFTTNYDWKMIMFVDFKYGAFQLRELEDNHISLFFIETQDMEIEVIGNIYENPELMEVD